MYSMRYLNIKITIPMNQDKTFKPTLLLLKNLTYKTRGILVIDKCLHTMVGGCVNFILFFILKKPLGKKNSQSQSLSVK